jgi:dolichol-phosphate mannosyltransferase
MACRLLIPVPTYNESRNVEQLSAELLALGLGADILFIDDNSPDGTGHILDGLAHRHPEVYVVHRERKLGIGSAHRAGILRAYDRGYELLVTMDADFSHNPSDLPRLLAALDADVGLVIGSRYLGRGSLPGWSLHRRFLTLFGHVLTRALLGMPYDATGALRLYDLRKIPRELFELTTARSYPFFYESLFVLHRNGVRVREIPIVLPARVYGSSKLTFREALRSGRFLLELFLARLWHPARFRVPRRIDRLRRDLRDSQGWDDYWSETRHGPGRLYDVVAGIYRRLVIRPSLHRFTSHHFPDGTTVLHAGCGSGQVDEGLHRRLRITAVDVSQRALTLYARNNPEAHHIEQASIFDLPFDAEAFDGVYSLGVLEHFYRDEIRAILAEFHRILRPGGKLLVFWPHRRGLGVVLLRVLGRVLRLVRGEEPRLHPPEVSLLGSRREAEAILCDAGFALVDYYFGVRELFVQCVVVGLKGAGSGAQEGRL